MLAMFPLFYWQKNAGLFQDFPAAPQKKIFQDLYTAHECSDLTYWHHKFKSRGLQAIFE